MGTVDTEMVRNMRDYINEQMGNDDYDRVYTGDELEQMEQRDFNILVEFLSSGVNENEFCMGKDFKPTFIRKLIHKYSCRVGSIRTLYRRFRNGSLKQCTGYEPENLGVIE